MALNMNYQLSR